MMMYESEYVTRGGYEQIIPETSFFVRDKDMA
jgi:hypothetical protein